VTINYRNLRNRQPGRPTAVLPRTTISGGVSPEARVRAMRAWLSSLGTTWHLPGDDSTDFQWNDGDVVSTAQIRWDSTGAGYRLPASDTLLPTWRYDEPLLAITDPAITRLARRIADGSTDPGAVSERVVHWVSTNIRKIAEPMPPSSVTVLRHQAADVDGHTVLFVALARAAGIPSRSVSGVLLAGQRFYFHSWAEVYLGRWIPVDPTYDEFPAGAGRIRIGIGTLARTMDLLPIIAGIDGQLLTLDKR
jgi:transglutaminase-like putative cysteine protease